jgi:hypothetical protein
MDCDVCIAALILTYNNNFRANPNGHVVETAFNPHKL